MRVKKLAFILAAVITISILGGCAKNGTADISATAAQKKFTIVTSFYPMYVATMNVAKDIDGVQVINLTNPQTGCLHDYQLTPQDLITLERADAFVVNGAGMEAFLDDAVKQQKNLKIVEASKGIELLKDKSGEYNAHVWVSVSNAIVQVRNIADQLSLINSGNAQKYRNNANLYITKLEELKQQMHVATHSLKNRDIITFHEAFPYFAKEFNLNIVAVIEREPGTAPSAKELANIIDTVKRTEVKALFAEPQYSKTAAQAIAKATGAEIYSLDPLVTGNSGGNVYDDYIRTMKANLKTLVNALS